MILTFTNITEARSYLTENGYSYAGQGKINAAMEIYEAGPLVATVRKVPFRGISVKIR